MIRKSLPALAVMLTLSLPAYAVAPCANDAEREAMAMRALQSEFMMAGVACNQAAAYNSFVTKYQSVISAEGVRLKSYFSRVYGGSGEKQLNDFITDIANAWSQVHMKDMQSYCNSTWERMWKANSTTLDRTALVAQARERAGVPVVSATMCAGASSLNPAPVVRTADATPTATAAKPKAKKP